MEIPENRVKLETHQDFREQQQEALREYKPRQLLLVHVYSQNDDTHACKHYQKHNVLNGGYVYQKQHDFPQSR